ncbi:unnamed protein product [Phaedon cochleariae]|uniref:C2H2-type domain-containing protein n=1 Tax=Phaedon cochleariae TaxID=80249 RepID=A0A9P0DHU1_PHACE|nr:unnamed protein product [Phaedon cochleariae]
MEKCDRPNICRACLTEDGKLQSVFTSEISSGLPLHISEMISSCTSFEVSLGDGLPDQICTECVTSTVKMYLFKLKCEHSDRILKERLKKVTVVYQNDLENENNKIKAETVECKDMEINNEILDDSDKFDFDTCKLDNEDDTQPVYPEKEESTLKEEKIKKFQCDICNKRFSRYDLLIRHKIAHAMKMEQQNVQYDGTFEMDDCLDVKHEEVVFTCLQCDTVFSNKEDLDVHLKKHVKLKKISCSACGKKFSKSAHLNRHMRNTHISEKQYKCTMCDKAFHRAEQLKNHMNGHTGMKPHVCDTCFKGFNQISNLKDHMRTHNGEKPFLCSTCGKGFNQLGNLRQHSVRHSGVKAHLCNTCGSRFASKGELSAHLRKHTGARPFVCTVCNHGFTTSSSLTKHKRIHSGEKPYECDTCKMKFSRSGILARHKRTHTGEKPYKCKYCDKAFAQSNDMISHQRIHTGEKPFICDECGQAFRQSSALKTHKKTHSSRGAEEEEDVEEEERAGRGKVKPKPILVAGVFNADFLPGF